MHKVWVRPVKIYVAAVEALRKKERQDETQFTTKLDGFLSLYPPCLMLMYIFLEVFFESHPVYDQTQGSDGVFPCFTDNTTLP
jgi:hypothetical protein